MSEVTGKRKKAAPEISAEDARLLEEQALEEEIDKELEEESIESSAEQAARDAEQALQRAAEAARQVALEAIDEAHDRGADDGVAEQNAQRAAAGQIAVEVSQDLPPAVVAIMAQMAAQTAAMTKVVETLAERQAGQSGAEITLSGSAEQLLRQLAGTVSDGGDGDDPLDEPVVFIAKGANTVVVKKGRNRMTMPDGSQAFTTGVHADFSPNGMFSTRNPEMIEYLKARPGYGTVYWELGNEPAAQVDPSAALERIFEMVMALDDAGLAEFAAEERATHKRVPVLQALAAARKQVQAFGLAQA